MSATAGEPLFHARRSLHDVRSSDVLADILVLVSLQAHRKRTQKPLQVRHGADSIISKLQLKFLLLHNFASDFYLGTLRAPRYN